MTTQPAELFFGVEMEIGPTGAGGGPQSTGAGGAGTNGAGGAAGGAACGSGNVTKLSALQRGHATTPGLVSGSGVPQFEHV